MSPGLDVAKEQAVVEYSANEELYPDLSDLSQLAYQAHQLMSDDRWQTDIPEIDEAEELAAESAELAKQLRDFSWRLGDIASG